VRPGGGRDRIAAERSPASGRASQVPAACGNRNATVDRPSASPITETPDRAIAVRNAPAGTIWPDCTGNPLAAAFGGNPMRAHTRRTDRETLMSVPRHALRVLPLALAPLMAMSAPAGAAPAAPHTIVRSTYGIDGPLAVTAGDRAVTVSSGGPRGASVASAEHRAGTALWPAAVSIASGLDGGVWGTRVATNATGDTLAVWMVAGGSGGSTTITIEGARRTGPRAWHTLPRLATITDAASMYRMDLPRTPLALAVAPDGSAHVAYGTPDGAVTALRLAPGAAAWDAPVTVRGPVAGRLAPDPADLALATAPDGTATLLWSENAPDGTRSIGFATLSAAGWSPPAPLPGALGGYHPDVDITPGGEVIAAWTTTGGNRVATRPAGGGWTADVRVGGGSSPEIAVGNGRVAITWGSSGTGVALRDAPGGAWVASRAPVEPLAAAFGRGDRLLVAGRLRSGVLAWARQTDAGAWGPARIASRQQDLIRVTAAAIAPASAGPLATLIWSGNVLEGRLGMPSGGTVLQGLDLRPDTGDAVGTAAALRLPTGSATVNAYAVLSLYPRFTRYAGPTPVRIQTRRGGRWHAVAAASADVDRVLRVRVGGPGRVQVRLVYGPGFRTATNAVLVRVRATALRRVVAGWYPQAVAAVGNDLWVLSANRAGTGMELRLLSGATGRLRRGPVRVATEPGAAELVHTGRRALLRDISGGRLRALDHARPGLIGGDATITAGSCEPTCTSTRLTVSGVDALPDRLVAGGGTLTGPDGTVWGFIPGPAPVDSEGDAIVVNGAAGTAPIQRGAVGPMSAHGGRSGTAIAAATGLWVRNAENGVSWTARDGSPVSKGSALAIAGTGACVWAAVGTNRLVRLRAGAEANGPTVRLGGAFLSGETPLTVAPRAAWVIAPFEQTLIRVPLPAC